MDRSPLTGPSDEHRLGTLQREFLAGLRSGLEGAGALAVSGVANVEPDGEAEVLVIELHADGADDLLGVTVRPDEIIVSWDAPDLELGHWHFRPKGSDHEWMHPEETGGQWTRHAVAFIERMLQGAVHADVVVRRGQPVKVKTYEIAGGRRAWTASAVVSPLGALRVWASKSVDTRAFGQR